MLVGLLKSIQYPKQDHYDLILRHLGGVQRESSGILMVTICLSPKLALVPCPEYGKWVDWMGGGRECMQVMRVHGWRQG